MKAFPPVTCLGSAATARKGMCVLAPSVHSGAFPFMFIHLSPLHSLISRRLAHNPETWPQAGWTRERNEEIGKGELVRCEAKRDMWPRYQLSHLSLSPSYAVCGIVMTRHGERYRRRNGMSEWTRLFVPQLYHYPLSLVFPILSFLCHNVGEDHER